MKSLPELCRLMANCEEMQSFDRLVNIAHLLMQTADVPGDVAEFGCHSGKTALFMEAITDKFLWLYDNFSGLPEPGPNDLNKQPFIKGGLRANIEDVKRAFMLSATKQPFITHKPIEALTLDDLPDSISFAHVDLDLYDPTLAALKLIWPKVSLGGVVIVDDANHPALPGVKSAMVGFMTDLPLCHQVVFNPKHIHAWIRKGA